MTRRVLQATAGIVAWLFALVMALYLLDLGRLEPMEGTQFVTELRLCDTVDCAGSVPQALPYYSPIGFGAARKAVYLQADLVLPEGAEGLQAVYFPRFTDTMDLTINGERIFNNTWPQRMLNIPLLVPIPEALLKGGVERLEVTLYGTSSEGLDLHPFYFGPEAILAPAHAARYFAGPGLARFALGMMGVLATTLLLAWSFRPRDKEYLWLGLACVAAMPTLVVYGFGQPLAGYTFWTMITALSPAIYVLFLLLFLRSLLKVSIVWPVRLYTGALLGGMGLILVLPADYTFILSIWSNIVFTAPLSLTILLVMWLNRRILEPLDMAVLWGSQSLAIALGVYALYLHLHPAPTRSMHLFHLMPLVMSLACIWQILSRLIHSLRGYERLTASLNATVARKSAELEASFAELAQIKRREAIAEERDRIMLDLHDGIGGHLVSTLAYMQRNNVGDAKVRRALEDALRDLALMLDSMENHDSLVTLLGMLRTRLEGLLSEHGIAFDWQVHAEPELPNPGPSQSLHLARIVQEAITNVIKHTHADTITIYVDEAEIRVSDNGQGFDLAEQAAREHPANGIANMRRRSETIGTKFRLASDRNGTVVSLLLQ